MNQGGGIVTEALIKYLINGLNYNALGIKSVLNTPNPALVLFSTKKRDKESIYVWASPYGKGKGVGVIQSIRVFPQRPKRRSLSS